MSYVCFHTENDGEVEIGGSERAYMGALCAKIANGIFDMLPSDRKAALIPSGHWARRGFDAVPRQIERDDVLDRNFSLLLSNASEDTFADGTRIFGTVLNTAMAVGSPAIKFCARIHGQCELHLYVEPPNFEWLISVIEEGLDTGVLRRDGPRSEEWQQVIALLSRAKGTVVTSYSVTGGFPNCDIAGWSPPACKACGGGSAECEECMGEPLWDSWYDLPVSEQWKLALSGLRRSESLPELEPGSFAGFGQCKTAFDYA